MGRGLVVRKTAIVTGSVGGIGKAVAAELIKEKAFVVLVDLDEAVYHVSEGLGHSSKEQVFALQADVTKRIEVFKMVESVIKRFGRIDVLVNCAGLFMDNLIDKMPEEDWDRVIDVNLKGTFLCTQAVTPDMKNNRGGKIINLSSVSYKGNTGQANYSASKGGVVSLTKTTASELAPYGINVNCVAPGPVNTKLLQGMDPKNREKLIQKIPLGRVGEPGEVAALVCFLSSNLANFITGAVIEIDGGLSTSLNLR